MSTPTIAQSAIVAAWVAVLSGASSLAGVPVARSRQRALSESATHAIVVRCPNSDPVSQPQLGAATRWLSQLRVECYRRTTDGSAPDDACSELLQRVHAVLLAAEPTFGGLVQAIDPPRLMWDEDEADASIGCAIAQYPVHHSTQPKRLTAATV
jgi:hypothetical protein